jgi:protein-disulfide isomerase
MISMAFIPFSNTKLSGIRASLPWTGALALTATLIVGCGAQTAQVDNSSFEAQLANHLDETGATMYGAYWCPHCADQKDMFGSAIDQVPYVECAADGENAQPQLCQEKGIQGYPTWEINGELYPGTQSLEQLADLSGFEGTAQP